MPPNDNSFLFQQIDDGKIDVANEYLKRNCNDKVNHTDSMNILIHLCNYVFKTNPDKTLIREIYCLTKTCCKNIKNVRDVCDKYLGSLFHIAKYFFAQLNLVEKTELGDVLGYLSEVADIAVEYYKNYKITSRVSKCLIELYNRNTAQCPIEQQSGWEKIALKALSLERYGGTDEIARFFLKLNSYKTFLMKTSVKKEMRIVFCGGVLDLLQDVTITDEELCVESYKGMLNLIEVITSNVNGSKDEDITVINKTVSNICRVMKSMYVKSRYMINILVIENIFGSVLKRVGERQDRDSVLLRSCVQNLNALRKSNDKCQILISTCVFFQRCLKIYITQYFLKRTDFWSLEFPVKFLGILFELFDILGVILEHEKSVYAYSLYFMSTTFLEMCIKLKIPFTEELHNLNLKCLEKCLKIVVYYLENVEANFETQWKYVGTTVYNCAVNLYSNKEFNFAKSYFFMLAKYIIVVDGVEFCTCFDNALSTVLYLYCSCLTSLSDFKRALTFVALLFLIDSSQSEKVLHLLIVIKSQKGNEDLKELTLRDILMNEVDTIREIYPDYKYDESSIAQVLVAELEFYYKKWPSKNLMHNVSSQIFATTHDPQFLAKAFYFTCRKIPILNNDNYLQILQSTINKFERYYKKDDFKYVMCLAVLYYCLYHSKNSELLEKIAEDMNEIPIPLQSTTQSDENESLDIIPTYQSLKIQTKLELLNYLVKSLELFKKMVQVEALPRELISEFCIVNIVRMIALEFRVQNFKFHSTLAWHLHLDYCKVFDNKHGIVESIGFILENCRDEMCKDLEQFAEENLKILEENQGEEEEDILELSLLYHLNKCYGMLNSGLVNEACKIFKEQEKKLKESGMNLPLITARLLHLKTRFLLTSCNEQLLCHKEMYLVSAHDCFATLAEIYKTRPSTDPYVLSLLIEAGTTVGWLYKWVRFPREVRCYTRDLVRITQKLLLPIRAAQIINILAYTDILDRQFNDCEVKLDGLIKLLNYRSDCSNSAAPVQQRKQIKNHLEVGKPSYKTSVRFLEAPHTRFRNVTGSPELSRKPFSMPNIFSHSDDCVCLTCANFEYHKLLFEIAHLEALLCHHTKGSCDRVEEYFDGCFLMEQKLSTKYNIYLNICQNDLHKSIYQSLEKPVRFSYCVFLLDNSYFLAQKGLYPQALKIIDQLKRYHWLKHANIIFMNEIRSMNITLQFAKIQKPPVKKSPKLSLNVSYETVVTKTPDNKVVATKVKLSVSPAPKVEPRQPIKALKLDFSDSDSDEIKQTPKPQQKPTKLEATPVFKPPEIKVNKYPANEIPTTSAILSTTAPSRSKTRAKQQERMKVLTEKLRAENKETIMNPVKKPTTRTRSAAQKENSLPTNPTDEITNRLQKVALDEQKPTKCACSQTRPNTRAKKPVKSSCHCK